MTKREIRVFFVRMALLCAAIAGVYWLGWRSPWARADATVHVETPGAPKAQPVVSTPATPVVTAPPTGSAPEASEVKPDKRTEINPESDKEDKPQEDSGKSQRRTRHKRSKTDD